MHVGQVTVRAAARVGARSMLLPGADVGERAEIAPGSAVFGAVPADEAWSGAPAGAVGIARGPWAGDRPANRPRWLAAYGAMAVAISLLPLLACLVAAALVAPAVSGAGSLAETARIVVLWLPAGVAVGYLALAFLVWLVVRLLSWGLVEGHHPVHGRQAWQAWSVLRVLDEARILALPALLELAHAGLVARARCQGRQGRRGLHRPADPLAHQHQRRRVPGRRHPPRRLRARRRLAARRAGSRSASMRSSATPAWPRPAARCPSWDSSPCCRPRRVARRPRAARRGSAALRPRCADSRATPTTRGRITRRAVCGRRAGSSSSSAWCPCWSRGCSSSASPWSSWPWPPTPAGGAPPRSPVWC